MFVTILGFVLAGDHSALESVKTSVLGRFPVIGTSINTGKLKGNVVALVIGVVVTLYSGLGVTQTAQNALNTVWGVPRGERPNFLKAKLQGLLLLAVLGTMFIVASGASGIVSGGLGGTGAHIAGYVVSLIVNFGLFMFSFKFLCSAKDLTWRTLIPGSIAAAVIWEILQVLGGVYIDHIKHSSDAYGTFALVIGVITWLHLGSQLTMYCAEANSVVALKAWPRSLFGPDNQVVPRRDGLDERELDRQRSLSVL